MIRYYIHEFLSDKPIDISAVDTSSYDGKPYRLVLKLNEPTSKLLKDTAEKYSLSVNVTLIRVCASIVKYYSKS